MWCPERGHDGHIGGRRSAVSDFEESRRLWRQQFAVQSISWKIDNVLRFAFDERHRDFYLGTRDPDEFMADFERYVQHLELPARRKIRRLLGNRVKALASGKKPTKTLERRLRELSAFYKESLAAVPPSLDKAKGSLIALIDIADFDCDQEYDAACLLREYVAPQLITRVVSEWKEQLRVSLERQGRPIPVVKRHRDSRGDSKSSEEQESIPSFLPTSYIFWSSRDFMETLDAMSRYRFMETFNIGEFPETVAEIENMFASALMESDPALLSVMLGDRYWVAVACDLWLASRSAMLCGRIRPFIEIALTRIANHQSMEGWWPTRADTEPVERYHRRYLPSSYETALACVGLLKLSRKSWQLERAKKGVQWLVKQQQHEGFWTSSPGGDQEEMGEPDLFTTLLAAEGIRASGLTGYESTVSMADSWIMNNQEPDGTWRDPGFPFPLMTVLVVEYLERRWPPLSRLGNYLSIARDFILRSREFALEDNENSWRLAIVVAFQGVEAFIYGCLSDHSISINIFERPGRTIGMRKALAKLEAHLQGAGVLQQGQSVEYRNSLDRLAYYRDEIVHKGVSVGKQETDELTGDVARFSELICQRILGHSLV